MKFLAGLFSLGFLFAMQTRADSINWTNTTGGDWNNAQNWSPNEVPGGGDSAAISAGVNVMIGATNFIGTLTLSPSCSLSVATNGMLTLLGSVSLSGVLTNAGAVVWQAGAIQLYNNPNNPVYYGAGAIWNQPGALFDIQCDQNMTGEYGYEQFNNSGTLRKSAGSGITTIGILFNNTGVVHAESGTIQFDGGGGLGGSIQADAGAAAYVGSGVYSASGALFQGAGLVGFSGGLPTITGTVSGSLNFYSESGLAAESALTLETNTTLNILGNVSLYGILTNLGTVTWQAGAIQVVNYPNPNDPFYGAGAIWNQPGALFDIQCDQNMTGEYGYEQFNNSGTLRKSAGSGITTIGILFNNTGVVHAESGTIQFDGGGGLGGSIQADAGAAAYVGSGVYSASGALFQGAGLVGFSGGLPTITGTVSGSLNFYSESGLAAESALTLETNTTLNILGNVSLYGILTNLGTVTWQAGAIQVVNYPNPNDPFYGTGAIWNQPGALFDIQCDQNMTGEYGYEQFNNSGTLRKSAGSGITTIGILFNNTGVVHAESGTIQFDGGGGLGGSIQADAGAAAYVGSGAYSASGALFQGAGSVGFSGGLPTVTGTVSGSLNFYSGSGLAAESVLTLETNTTLNILGSVSLSGILTNLGTVTWQAGAIQVVNYPNPNDPFYGTGAIWNQPGALFDIQCDQGMPAYYGNEQFNNSGTLRKSAGSGTTTIGILFNNTGVVHAESGTIQFDGGGGLGGSIQADAGAAAYVGSGVYSASGALFQGPGLVGFSGGAPTLTGAFSGALNFYTGSGLGAGSALTVATNGTLNFYDGSSLGVGSTLTVGTNVTLNILGSVSLSGILTNLGTVTWQAGAIQVVNYPNNPIYGTGTIWNQPGALFDIQCDQNMTGEYGYEQFNNSGTLRKSAGSGITTIGILFNNTGVVHAESGTIQFDGGGGLGGSIQADAGAAAYVGSGVYSASGALFQGAGLVGFSGGAPTLTGAFSGALNFYTGSGLGAGSALTVATNGTLNFYDGSSLGVGSTLTVGMNVTLNILGSVSLSGILTNLGTVIWQAGAIQVVNYPNNPIYGTGTIWNQPGALFDIQCDKNMSGSYSYEQFNNSGTLRKSAGSGITTIGVIITNMGTFEAKSGLLSLTASYNPTPSANLILDLAGTNAGADFGQIQFATAAPLTGAFSVATLNSYIPNPGDSFKVLIYPSATGDFTKMTGLDLGNGLRLDPVFSKTSLTLNTVSYPVGPSPTLVMHRANGGEFLFRPGNFATWQLQSATNLANPDWRPYAVAETNYGIIQPLLPQQYFRLKNN